MKKKFGILIITISLLFCGCGKNADIKNVEEAINTIGIVTSDSEDAVSHAERLYSILTEKEKSKVENRQILIEAREKLDDLKKEKETIVKSLLGTWVAEDSVQDFEYAEAYTFNIDNTFSFQSLSRFEGVIIPVDDEQGNYIIDMEDSKIKLIYNTGGEGLKNEIPYSLENGEFIFFGGKHVHIK